MTHIYRTGDLVGLTGKVRHNHRHDEDSFVFVDVAGHHSALMINPENLTLIAPRIDAGERVRWTNGNEGTVLASDADKLWVKLDDGSYVIWPAKEVTVLVLKAVDPEPVEPAPAPLNGKVGSEEEF
jgi:hypothetical protein